MKITDFKYKNAEFDELSDLVLNRFSIKRDIEGSIIWSSHLVFYKEVTFDNDVSTLDERNIFIKEMEDYASRYNSERSWIEIVETFDGSGRLILDKINVEVGLFSGTDSLHTSDELRKVNKYIELSERNTNLRMNSLGEKIEEIFSILGDNSQEGDK